VERILRAFSELRTASAAQISRSYHLLAPEGTSMSAPLGQGRLRLSITILGWLCLSGATLPGAATPQPAPTAGVVLDGQTLQPLSDVVVTAGGVSAVTDRAGRFRLDNVSGSELELVARRIGYRPISQRVRVGDQAIRINMAATAINLEEVIVTGTPGATERRALSNSVSTVDVSSASEIAPTRSVTDLLQGRAAGVVAIQPGGVVGGGPRIKVRGVASLSLTDQPLLYVDGIRVDNTTASGPVGRSVAIVSRLNDFNPEDIESMEIVKGPSAATLYGTEAANGVIQIITKRGRRGPRAAWDVITTQGASWFANPAERIGPSWATNPAGQPFSLNFVEREEAAGRSPFRTGHSQTYGLNVSGGTDALQYFLSGNFEQQEGIDPTNDMRRTGGRLNLTTAPMPSLRVTANVGYLTGLTNFPADGGFGGPVWSLIHGRPLLADSPSGGWTFGAPRDWQEAFFFSQGLDRVTGGLQLEHRPTGWLSQRLNLGIDRISENNINLIPRMNDRLLAVFGGGLGAGSKTIQDRSARTATVDFASTATAQLGSIESQTSVGLQLYRRIESRKTARGDAFPTGGLEALSSTARTSVSEDGVINNTTVGTFLQQQLSWQRRLFLTAGIRADDNSAFGSDFNAAVYPKIGLAWVVSDEPFGPSNLFNTLRLRASYGQSGQQPAAFAALRRYLPTTGGDGNPAVTPSAVGNPDLKPERGVELEAGFELGLLNERVGVDFTWYHKTTRDAIVAQELAPSAGFPGTRLANLGKIRNRGFELQVSTLLIESRPAALELLANIAHNNDEVLEVGNPNGFISLGNLRHQVGYPIASWFGPKIISADLNATGQAINVLCDNGSGGGVACASAPAVFHQRSLPTTTGSLAPTLTLFNRLRLTAMVEVSRGRWMIDGDMSGRCAESSTCRQLHEESAFTTSEVAGAQTRSSLNYALSDASYTKLREVSANYTLPEGWVRSLGAARGSVTLSAYNVATWTNFTGIDPETSISVGDVFGATSYGNTPPLTRIVGAVRLSF